MGPKNCVVKDVVKAAKSVCTLNCKIKLLKKVLTNGTLLSSNIISSVSPSIGKKFCYADLSSQANAILINCRKQLLQLSVSEAERSLSDQRNALEAVSYTHLTLPTKA